MATNIPPHNLGEVCDALLALIENPDLTLEKILDIIPGPDFPTGGQLLGRQAVRQAYLNKRGSLTMRALAAVETDKRSGRASIIVREIPYQVNKTRLMERIAELVNDRRIEGISDLRDESDRDGMRIVIELKRDYEPKVVLNQLFKLTQMQQTYGLIMLGIHEGRPREMDLREMLHGLPRPSPARADPPHPVRAAPGRGAPARFGRLAGRAAKSRRGNQADSRRQGRRDRPQRADGPLQAEPDSGPGDPRPDACAA